MTPIDPTDDPLWDRLIHLVAGELPAGEADELRRWVDADPQRRATLARLEEIWRATAPDPAPESWDAEAELRRIRAAGEAGRVIARVGPDFERIHGSRSRARTALRVAAMLALAAGAGYLWQLRPPVAVAPPTAPVAMTEYRTAPGERLGLRLPDGTRVMLAPGGVLRRPSTYGAGDRIVHLEGEAYFRVTHDSTRPFAVHTDRALVRDLGTRFVVRAYAGEKATAVVVAEGIVAVGRATGAAGAADPLSADSLVLTPRQLATIAADGPIHLTSGVALDAYLSWTEGRLVFRRTPLHEVVRQLKRWYGIDIELADPRLGDRRLTATLEQEGAAEALDLVALSLDLRVSRSGTVYLLRRARP